VHAIQADDGSSGLAAALALLEHFIPFFIFVKASSAPMILL
jgi:hypothetical protein